MKITAKDIAREAGVSEATVSIILNNKAGHYRISEKTRQKVLEIAERYQLPVSLYPLQHGKRIRLALFCQTLQHGKRIRLALFCQTL